MIPDPDNPTKRGKISASAADLPLPHRRRRRWLRHALIWSGLLVAVSGFYFGTYRWWFLTKGMPRMEPWSYRVFAPAVALHLKLAEWRTRRYLSGDWVGSDIVVGPSFETLEPFADRVESRPAEEADVLRLSIEWLPGRSREGERRARCIAQWTGQPARDHVLHLRVTPESSFRLPPLMSLATLKDKDMLISTVTEIVHNRLSPQAPGYLEFVRLVPPNFFDSSVITSPAHTGGPPMTYVHLPGSLHLADPEIPILRLSPWPRGTDPPITVPSLSLASLIPQLAGDNTDLLVVEYLDLTPMLSGQPIPERFRVAYLEPATP